MADSTTITLRARDAELEDFNTIKDWCDKNKIAFSAVINSYLPAIAFALTHMSFYDDETSQVYVRSEFGDVPIKIVKGRAAIEID